MTNPRNVKQTIQFLKVWANREVRAEFDQESRGLQLVCFRIACLVIMFFVLAFSELDYFIIPSLWSFFLKIRLACAGFVALLLLLSFVFSDFVKRHIWIFYFITFVGASVFLSWMVMMTGGHRSIYYAGINLAILMQGALMPLASGFVFVNSFGMFLTYFMPIFIFDRPLITPAHLANNCAFMLMTIVLTLVSNTVLYFVRFQEFYGRKNLHSLNKQLHELAMKDSLTGLFNNRFLKHQLDVAVKFSKRYASAFSILMIDLDHFKEFNDNYGHLGGDRVLQETAKVILSQIRGIDYAIRYGGDEFTVILTNAVEQSASLIKDRIKQAIESHPFYVGKERHVITACIGSYTYLPEQGELSSEELLRRADWSLYEAKAKRLP